MHGERDVIRELELARILAMSISSKQRAAAKLSSTARHPRTTGKKTNSRKPAKAKTKVAKVRAERVLLEGGSRASQRKIAMELASRLDRNFCCVDLARITGKYIGETEKNLARVLALAEGTGAVLLFDEADALFGKRTDVKDSHDRFVNQDTSRLLRRIEDYSGPVILASNFKNNLDSAFLRRAGFVALSAQKRR